MTDIVVREGTVVDGTGADAYRADIVVANGRVVAIDHNKDEAPSRGRAASAPSPSTRVIDASGCWVTPGFIDPHTHLDAQLCWDGAAGPSIWHGVTSVVIGLCGFGVAPAHRQGGAEYLLRSLERVEEIPYESTASACRFTWSSWSEYFGVP